MYSPKLGRFLTEDPLTRDPTILHDNNWFGDALTLMKNKYGYCGNNPINATDPSGLHSHDDCDRWYEQCGDTCRAMPNRTWWDRNRRRICWANCFSEYAACIATIDEVLIGAGCIAVGAVVVCCAPVTVTVGVGAACVAVVCTTTNSE